MILYDINDSDVLLKDAQYSKLSILVGMDSFSYMIQHPERGLHWFRAVRMDENSTNVLQKLEFALRGEASLQRQFADISVGFTTPLFTALPDRLYRRGQERTYLEHIGELGVDDLALVDDLMPISAHQVYKVPEQLVHVLQQVLHSHRHRHWSTLFINHFGNHLFEGSGHHVYFYQTNDTLRVLHFRDGQLLFQNAFSFQSAKDGLYFAMLVFNQQGISPQDATIHLCGHLAKDSGLYMLMEEFMPGIQPLSVPANIKVADALRVHPEHFYVDHTLNLA